MTKLNFNLHIQASPAKVWQVLWSDTTYRKWTAAFHEGSYAVSDWKEGSGIQFLTPEGNGMFSEIAERRTNEYMAFRHLGEIKNFEKQPIDEKTKAWSGGVEAYRLQAENEGTNLEISLDAPDDFLPYFNEAFPKALQLIKDLAEKPVVLTVATTVNAPIEKVWMYWTTPEHITGWNNASPDWHTPNAENDLRAGGKFVYRMEARDGSMGFDFGGTYDIVVAPTQIDYTLGDNRKVHTIFKSEGDATPITVQFEAEEMNSLELQQSGWQSIMDNFKTYAEAKG